MMGTSGSKKLDRLLRPLVTVFLIYPHELKMWVKRKRRSWGI